MDADGHNKCDGVLSDQHCESLRDNVRQRLRSAWEYVRADTNRHVHRAATRVYFLGYRQRHRANVYADVY